MSVWLVNKSTGDTLLIDDDTGGVCDYITEVFGLWDIPAMETQMSTGYTGGAVAVGQAVKLLPRQFSMRIHINQGDTAWPRRNAQHNAARDTLIQWLIPGEPVIVRTVYPGTSDYWDIEAIPQNGPWEVGTANYNIALIAPDPAMKHTQLATQDVALPDAGTDQKIVSVTASGNVPTYPKVVVTPVTAKAGTWRWRRIYQVQNPNTFDITRIVALPFDFGWHSSNGRIMTGISLGQDIRVSVGGVLTDRWYSNTGGGASGKIWVILDLPASQTVEVSVIYGNMSASAWLQSAGSGPMFDPEQSANGYWVFDKAFMDIPGYPREYTPKWVLHSAWSTGMEPINRYLYPSPDGWPDGPHGVNAAGGEIRQNVQVQGYAGVAYHDPIGIERVQHSGKTKTDTTKVKLALRSQDPVSYSLSDDWTQDTDTSGALTDYGPIWTPSGGNYPSPRSAVVFALRSLSVHQGTAGFIGAANWVKLQFPSANVPQVTGASSGTTNEEGIYMLQLELENQTTGDYIKVTGQITNPGGAGWNTAVIDLDKQIVQMGGGSFAGALEIVPPIRGRWWKLRPGINSVRVKDVGSSSGSCNVHLEWNGRRL